MEDLEELGFNWIRMGLQDVLYNPQTGDIFTPNTGKMENLQGVSLKQMEENSKIESRANPNHDPKTGRFTSASGKNTFMSNSDNLVANKPENGIINIEIDELSPCLRRLSDGAIVKTEIVKVKPTKKEYKDWEFDWTLPEKEGFSVYGIKAEGDKRIQGLIAMKPDARNSAYHVDIVEASPFNNSHNPKNKKKEYSGVGGHLFAEAVRKSLDDGFGGAVYFTAKSDLIDYYKKELGAELTNPRLRLMFIDEGAALKLHNKYYGGKEDES